MANQDETDFSIGQQAIAAYSRLSYTMWHAVGEFIDNSTQSRENYQGIINKVLEEEGTPLVVEITYDRLNRTITITDNSIGMSHDKLVAALQIAVPTADSRGPSRFGMGMKTAACWIGKSWRVITAEWSSGEEWTATRRGRHRLSWEAGTAAKQGCFNIRALYENRNNRLEQEHAGSHRGNGPRLFGLNVPVRPRVGSTQDHFQW